jgi:hypothetical protein
MTADAVPFIMGVPFWCCATDCTFEVSLAAVGEIISSAD